MDTNIQRRRWDPEHHENSAPAPAPAELRGQYQYPLIEIARTVAQMAAQRDRMTANELLTAPCPLEPHSALVVAARGACLERGFLADGQVPRGASTDDRREEPITPPPAGDYSVTITAPSEPGHYVLNQQTMKLEKLFDAGPLDLTQPPPASVSQTLEEIQTLIGTIARPADPFPVNRAPGWNDPAKHHMELLQKLVDIAAPHVPEDQRMQFEATGMALRAAYLSVLRYPPVLQQTAAHPAPAAQAVEAGQHLGGGWYAGPIGVRYDQRASAQEAAHRPLDLDDLEFHATAGWRITLTPKTVLELVSLARVGQAAQAQQAAAPAPRFTVGVIETNSGCTGFGKEDMSGVWFEVVVYDSTRANPASKDRYIQGLHTPHVTVAEFRDRPIAEIRAGYLSKFFDPAAASSVAAAAPADGRR